MQQLFLERGLPPLEHEPDVLVACELSGLTRDAYTRRGVHAVSCDLEPSETPGPHFSSRATCASCWRSRGGRSSSPSPPAPTPPTAARSTSPTKRADGRQWAGLMFVLELLTADADAVMVEQPRSVFGAYLVLAPAAPAFWQQASR